MTRAPLNPQDIASAFERIADRVQAQETIVKRCLAGRGYAVLY